MDHPLGPPHLSRKLLIQRRLFQRRPKLGPKQPAQRLDVNQESVPAAPPTLSILRQAPARHQITEISRRSIFDAACWRLLVSHSADTESTLVARPRSTPPVTGHNTPPLAAPPPHNSAVFAPTSRATALSRSFVVLKLSLLYLLTVWIVT